MTDFGGRTRSSVADDPAQAALSAEETAVLPVAPDDDPVVRRTKDGWRVGGSDLPDLTSAMVLADLISAELASSQGPAGAASDAATARRRGRPA